MILTGEGKPFKKPGAAALAASRKKIKDFKIEAIEGGWAIIEKNETVKNVLKAATTKPWDASNSSWKPDAFKTNKQHEGMELHFSTKANVQIRLDEGYVCAMAVDWGSNSDGTDGILRRQGMVGMEISIEKANERRAYNAYQVSLRSGKTKQDLMRNAQNIIDESKSGTGLDSRKGQKRMVHNVC